MCTSENNGWRINLVERTTEQRLQTTLGYLTGGNGGFYQMGFNLFMAIRKQLTYKQEKLVFERVSDFLAKKPYMGKKVLLETRYHRKIIKIIDP